MQNINWKDDNDIYGRMLTLTNLEIFNNFRNALDNHQADLTDALSWGQLKSKRWLISELEKLNLNLGTVFICAGWYGTLAAMMDISQLQIDKIRSFDIDPECESIADTVNRHSVKNNWSFKASTLDIYCLGYDNFEFTTLRYDGTAVQITETANTVINTSCEHLEDFISWYNKIPSGKLVILQANDYHEIDEHVNTYNTLAEFSASASMLTVLYEGELALPKYTRFMKIGFK